MKILYIVVLLILLVACSSVADTEDIYIEYVVEHVGHVTEGNEEVAENPELEALPEILDVDAAESPIPVTHHELPTGNVVSVSASSNQALALMDDGTLWAWGTEIWAWDEYLQQSVVVGVGDGTRESRNRPVQIMEDVTFALAAPYHSLAITSDGGLWTWGTNPYGNLGDGTTEYRLSPVRVMENVVYATMLLTLPNSHVGTGARTYAIQSDGSLWAWGQSGMGNTPNDVALGDGGAENRHTPIRILENAISVAATDNGGFAVTNDGRLWGWHGEIFRGYFDVETQTWKSEIAEAQRIPIPIMDNISTLCQRGTYVITTDGTLWALGIQGINHEHVASHMIAGALNGEANFVIFGANDLWAWGRNRLPDHWRQGPLLGDGTTIDRHTPVHIMENVASITSVGNATYAITTGGTLWAWGNNGGALGSGLLGDGAIFVWDDIEDYMWDFYRATGHWGEFEDGVLWLLDDDGGTGVRLSPVKIMENVVSVTATYFMLGHGWIDGFRTFAVTESGELWAWGENSIGGHDDWSWLGDGSGETRLYPVRII